MTVFPRRDSFANLDAICYTAKSFWRDKNKNNT